MESTFLFSLVGLSVFAAKLASQKLKIRVRLYIFIFTGMAAGLGVGLIIGFPLSPAVEIPRMLTSVFGGIGGLILFYTNETKLIYKPGIQYITTVFLGSLLAGISYGITLLYIQLSGAEVRMPVSGPNIAVIFLLMGFMIIFGFTFPERWFKQRGLH